MNHVTLTGKDNVLISVIRIDIVNGLNERKEPFKSKYDHFPKKERKEPLLSSGHCVLVDFFSNHKKF